MPILRDLFSSFSRSSTSLEALKDERQKALEQAFIIFSDLQNFYIHLQKSYKILKKIVRLS